MPVESTIKRIGGSTFALLPPSLVKELGLQPGDMVNIEVTRRGKTLKDIEHLLGKGKGDPELARILANWSEERPGKDPEWYETGRR